jgi:hypothetical protein
MIGVSIQTAAEMEIASRARFGGKQRLARVRKCFRSFANLELTDAQQLNGKSLSARVRYLFLQHAWRLFNPLTTACLSITIISAPPLIFIEIPVSFNATSRESRGHSRVHHRCSVIVTAGPDCCEASAANPRGRAASRVPGKFINRRDKPKIISFRVPLMNERTSKLMYVSLFTATCTFHCPADLALLILLRNDSQRQGNSNENYKGIFCSLDAIDAFILAVLKLTLL